MQPLINLTSFPKIVALLDFIYKKAIMDCIDKDDVHSCNKFLKEMKSGKKYGLIEFEYEMTWREWKNLLYFFCLRKRLNSVALIFDYINSMSTYYSVLLPVAMEFYLKGVSDFIECPYEDDYLRFSESRLEVWGKPDEARTRRRMMDDMLQLVMERRHRKIEDPMLKAKSDLIEPSDTNYDAFTESMWRINEHIKQGKNNPTVYSRGKERKIIIRKPKKQ